MKCHICGNEGSPITYLGCYIYVSIGYTLAPHLLFQNGCPRCKREFHELRLPEVNYCPICGTKCKQFCVFEPYRLAQPEEILSNTKTASKFFLALDNRSIPESTIFIPRLFESKGYGRELTFPYRDTFSIADDIIKNDKANFLRDLEQELKSIQNLITPASLEWGVVNYRRSGPVETDPW